MGGGTASHTGYIAKWYVCDLGHANNPGSARLRESFTQGLLSTSSRDRTDHTLAVLRATTSVEYGQYDTKTGPRAISVLLSDIPAYPRKLASVLRLLAARICLS